MIRIVFLIASLRRGGAETQLTLLVRGLDHTRFHCTVVTIYDGGDLISALDGIENVEVVSVSKGGRRDSLASLVRLSHVIRDRKPDIVHGYLDSSNVLALVTGKRVKARIVWGVRSSDMGTANLDAVSRLYRRLGALLSSRADLVIANSSAGRTFVTSIGYPPERVVTIPNGFDTDRFAPDPAGRARARAGWGIVGDTPVVGLVARIDPIKDHPTFLRAAALLVERMPEVKFACIGGGGTSEYERELRQLAADLSLTDHLTWVGETLDMPAAHNGLDVASLVSTSEGFANAVGEAMSCAVPCVVTDVGDSAEIVGDTGLVVRPGDPEALSDAWQRILTCSPAERAKLGARARARIVDHFSVTSLVNRSTAALLSLVEEPESPGNTDEGRTQAKIDDRCA